MSIKQLERWTWILIYGGLLGACLGWFLQPEAAVTGLTLMLGGGVVAAAGAVLVVLRSRLGP